MRRFVYFSLASVLFVTTALTAAPVFAADAGTYRPGNTYNSVTANSPDICEMQCSGDAQCRSWNFVQASEMTSGVCEFNDTTSTPVSSAISISGDNISRARSTRILAGKTNTVRVGAPSVTQALARMTPQPEPRTIHRKIRPQTQQAASQHSGLSLMEQQRLNDRQTHSAAPQRLAPPATAQHSLRANAHAPKPPRPQFRHNLEDGNQGAFASAQTRQGQRPAPQPHVTPQGAQTAYMHADPRLQKRLAQQQGSPQRPAQTYPPVQQPPAEMRSAAAEAGLSAPPGVPPLASAPAMPSTPAIGRSPYMAPTMAGAPQPMAPPRVNIPSELSPRPMGSSDSLFGSLYDDVKVPRPVDPMIAADPDAPIPTVSSVPAARISTGPLPPPR